MCGHPFPHHRVGVIHRFGVIIKGPEPSPPWRFPSEVKGFGQYYYYYKFTQSGSDLDDVIYKWSKYKTEKNIGLY